MQPARSHLHQHGGLAAASPAAATAARRQRTTAGGAAARNQQQQQQRLCHCCANITDRELEIKLAIAQSTDRLDLSDCQLGQLPPEVCGLTNLQELSIAGNQLRALQPGIASLANLRRLVLAGNLFDQLPPELLELSCLEGLWVHGNLLEAVPEALGRLTKLKQLSLAGNRLAAVPDSLTQLVGLTDLNLSGNQLTAVPQGLVALTGLKKLALNGNALTQLPQQGWGALQQLDELCVQGNALTALPDSLAQLGALTELSIGDNAITALPEDLSGWSSLRKAHFYGNQLQALPLGPRGLPALLLPGASSSSNGGSGSSSSGPSLASLWLEGNPLSPGCIAQLLQLYGDAYSSGGSSGRRQQPRVGLDDQQLAAGSEVLAQWQQLQEQGLTNVRRGIVKGEGPGYFKLQLGPTSPLNSSSSRATASSSSSSSNDGRVLVVAFGSAPGLPNWGGVLAKVAAAAESPEQLCFDVLYVVDPDRSWYCGGDPALMQQRYTSRLEQYTQQYKHVVMMGDSMGATACLLFAPLATSVLAFCPQVDLSTSSIRPGQSQPWQAALQEQLHAAVSASSGRVTIYTGTWQHDLDQANLLSSYKNVVHKVHSVDSHRLALALASQDRLAPILREAVLAEVGIISGNIRVANML